MDGLDKLLRELIEFVKNASPVIWAALVKQVYVVALQHAIWIIVPITSLIVFFSRQIKEAVEDDNTGELTFYVWIFRIVALIVMIGLASAAIARVINPDFYAIQLILDSLGGR